MKETKKCKTCNKEFIKKSFGKSTNGTWSRKIYCSKYCKLHDKCGCGQFKNRDYNSCLNCKDQTGNKNPIWKGGKLLTGEGYVLIQSPSHPRANKKGYVLEHHLVMERFVGRYLKPEEVIHHLDFDKANNDIDNLHLFPNSSEHTSYHEKLRGFVRDFLRGEI